MGGAYQLLSKMIAFLIILLQQVLAILGFLKPVGKTVGLPTEVPIVDLEPGLQIGLRHRAPFTVEVH